MLREINPPDRGEPRRALGELPTDGRATPPLSFVSRANLNKWVVEPTALAAKLGYINQAFLAGFGRPQGGASVEQMMRNLEGIYGPVLMHVLVHLVHMERDAQETSGGESSGAYPWNNGEPITPLMEALMCHFGPDAHESFRVLREATRWKKERPNAFCNLGYLAVDFALQHNIATRLRALSETGQPHSKQQATEELSELLASARIWGRERATALALGYSDSPLATGAFLNLRRQRKVPGRLDVLLHCLDLVRPPQTPWETMEEAGANDVPRYPEPQVLGLKHQRTPASLAPGSGSGRRPVSVVSVVRESPSRQHCHQQTP
jgi:hypothetical protein